MPVAYNLISLNSRIVTSFSQKALPKRRMKITFWKIAFSIQTTLLNSSQPNTNLAVLINQNSFFSKKLMQPNNPTHTPPPRTQARPHTHICDCM